MNNSERQHSSPKIFSGRVNEKTKTRGNKNLLRFLSLTFAIALVIFTSFSNSGCNVYKFRDISIPDSIRTVKVNFIDNRAPYVNPQLSPRLTDKLRQKIVSQTRLTQTNNDNADWDIKGYISNYTSTTSGISQQQVAANRLTISVHITVTDQKSNKALEYDISRNFEYAATLSLPQAEAQKAEEIIRDLTDDIFNRVFSNW